jgi:hypothetical protein
VDAGQNVISAMLQRARARAIGLQAPRGVFFFEDQTTKKMAMVLVRIDDPSSAGGANPFANVLELDEEAEDFQTLPMGVGAAFVLGSSPGGSGSASGPGVSIYQPYGLVAFDAAGRIMTVPSFTTYAKGDPRYPTPPDNSARNTRLWARYKDYIGLDVMDLLGKSQSGQDQQISVTTILLFDKAGFSAQPGTGASPALQFSTQQAQWLDNNGLALSVNRYNGTIVRSE